VRFILFLEPAFEHQHCHSDASAAFGDGQADRPATHDCDIRPKNRVAIQ
jgi:hypothetical protein